MSKTDRSPLNITSAISYNTLSDNDVVIERDLQTPEPVAGITTYHCHTREKNETSTNQQARRTLMLASGVCLAFMIAEIIGGSLANSLAIITDAAHLLTDFASFLISLFSLYIASMKPSRKMNFGWHRAEVMGALASVLMIWMITAILVFIAIQRIISGDYQINAVIMLITAAVGVLVNIVMGLILHYGGHTHSHGGVPHREHGHAHADTKDMEAKQEHGHSHKTESKGNLNVRAAFIHVLGDLCQSIGVCIAALIIYIWPEAKIADPICTFLFSVLVLLTTVAILRDTLSVLMEGLPSGINFGEVLKSLESVEGVEKVHNLRIWSLTLEKVTVSVHLAVNESVEAQRVLHDASVMLEHSYAVYESTIQIEVYHEDMSQCLDCEQPDQK